MRIGQNISSGSFPISELVDQVIDRYDANRNNVIDLKSEQMRTDDFTIAKHRHSIFEYQMQDLFQAADVNGDSVVTRDELQQTIQQFDRNGDAKLTKMVDLFGDDNEFGAFDKRFGEKIENIFTSSGKH